MEVYFDHLMACRNNIVNLIEASKERIYDVPKGYNNSIFWNACHIIVTQQILCYKLSGLDYKIDEKLIDAFKKGTKADASHDNLISLSDLKVLLLSSANDIKTDYQNDIFKNFTEYPTSFGITLTNIEDAISFNNMHESLHLGYMMAMRKNLF